MASGIPAIRGQNRQIVVAIDVAVGAGVYLAGWRHLVGIRERKSGDRVIECHICPQRGIVAVRTIRRCKRRSRSRVCGVVRLLPRRQVAPGIPAVIRLNRQIVIVIDVAVGAGIHLASRGHLV